MITIEGAPGSPYSMKMLAVLRYRRIPYRLIYSNMFKRNPALPEPKRRMLPVVYVPDAGGALEAHIDTTPIIQRLEQTHQARPILPQDPAMRLLSDLIEDYADEWLTQCMFHYRWHFEADAQKAATLLPLHMDHAISDEAAHALTTQFGARQKDRLRHVGSTPETAPVIEDSYLRFITALEAHLTDWRFVLGNQPTACDFAIYGQLSSLVGIDPTSMALTLAHAPRVFAWVALMSDLSGWEHEDGTIFAGEDVPATLTALLQEIGRTYVPRTLANAQAFAAGEAQFETEVDGVTWKQATIGYQAKCLAELHANAAALSQSAACSFAALLDGSGCEALYAGILTEAG